MTATLTTPASTTHTAARTGSIVKTGAVSGLVAAAATSAIAAITGPLEVADEAIPTSGFAVLTLIAVVIGAVLAIGLAKKARSPRRTFVVTTSVLTAASLVPDVLADATTGTRLALMLTHLVAAAIVIPALASRLSD